MNLVVVTPERSYVWEVDDLEAVDVARASVGFPADDSVESVLAGWRVEVHEDLHPKRLAELEPGPDLSRVPTSTVDAHRAARQEHARARRLNEVLEAARLLDPDELAELKRRL